MNPKFKKRIHQITFSPLFICVGLVLPLLLFRRYTALSIPLIAGLPFFFFSFLHRCIIFHCTYMFILQ